MPRDFATRLLVAALVLVAAAHAPCVAQAPAAEPVEAAKKPPPPTAAELYEAIQRHFAERRLSREAFVTSLTQFDRPDALVLADTIYREYAEAIGPAEEAFLSTCFAGSGDDRAVAPLAPTALRDAGTALTSAVNDATKRACDALAAAGANADRPAESITQDLLKRISARAFQYVLAGFQNPDSAGFDCWDTWRESQKSSPEIAQAAAKAHEDPDTRAALDAAAAAFRREGAELARILLSYDGVAATQLASLPNPPDAAEYERFLADCVPLPLRWRDANDECAEAIERVIVATGNPHAAAEWTLSYLARTASRAITPRSKGQMLVDTASMLGASAEELTTMRAILRESAVERAARARAVVKAYDRWLRSGGSRLAGEPSEDLLEADAKRDALESRVCERVLAAVQSPLLREDLKESAIQGQPMEPVWKAMFEQRRRASSQGTPTPE